MMIYVPAHKLTNLTSTTIASQMRSTHFTINTEICLIISNLLLLKKTASTAKNIAAASVRRCSRSFVFIYLTFCIMEGDEMIVKVICRSWILVILSGIF